jgi:hypothetical protein
MKEYGTEKSEHLGTCNDCKEKKVVRWFLTIEQKEVEVCEECYRTA